MDSNNDFVHGGPRIQQLNTNTSVTGSACSAGISDCFIPLPAVTTTWSRLAADVKYFFTRTVGIGFAYWYERLDVADFATVDANGWVAFTPPTGTVRVDYLGGLMTGYGARDYRGNTASVCLLYLLLVHGRRRPHGTARVVRGRTDDYANTGFARPCGLLHLQAFRRDHDRGLRRHGVAVASSR